MVEELMIQSIEEGLFESHGFKYKYKIVIPFKIACSLNHSIKLKAVFPQYNTLQDYWEYYGDAYYFNLDEEEMVKVAEIFGVI